MADIFDYIKWRGDLSMDSVPLGAVDALMLSALSYIRFRELAPDAPEGWPTLRETAERFFALPEWEQTARIRAERDARLLDAMAESERFGALRIAGCRELLDEERQMQFAAVSFITPGGDAAAVFRGTDGTLVGWKEDFNLGFLDTVPGQWMARDYLEKLASAAPGRIYSAGHSKGGNLAVFAAAYARESVRERVEAVYNNDGPGFSLAVSSSEEYRRMLPRIHTLVPQSSVVGMLLEHEEPYTIVRSSNAGLWQHDLYSWVLDGPDFERLESVTASSRLVDETLKAWISDMTPEARCDFADGLYELIQATDAEQLGEIAQPRNIYALVQFFRHEDEESRRRITGAISTLMHAAARTIREIQRQRV